MNKYLNKFRYCCLILFVSSSLRAEFNPADVILVCNKKYDESCNLANFYSTQRKVPEENILRLETSKDESISREEFNQTILSPLRKELEEKRLLSKALVLITFYGVPLSINESESPSSSNSNASVDSELTLLKVPPGRVPINNNLKNPLYIKDIKDSAHPQNPSLMSAIKTMVLVSRLDASSPELVKKIIQDTIETEKTQSLKGNFLIDSRGIPWTQNDTYAEWDKDLVNLARNIETGSRFDIEFDSDDKLAGETTEVALYTGWYSLRNYENLYTFSKGSIGFHIASEEAVSLRNKEEKGWCKNLLEHGVVATLGAVSEPFLESFPKPNDFFTLLLSGKYQLVEAYYLTSKLLSWKMLLIGDPLYKPISEKTAREEFDYDTEGYNELPIAPSALMKN